MDKAIIVIWCPVPLCCSEFQTRCAQATRWRRVAGKATALHCTRANNSDRICSYRVQHSLRQVTLWYMGHTVTGSPSSRSPVLLHTAAAFQFSSCLSRRHDTIRSPGTQPLASCRVHSPRTPKGTKLHLELLARRSRLRPSGGSWARWFLRGWRHLMLGDRG